jgi:hypothetical protein
MLRHLRDVDSFVSEDGIHQKLFVQQQFRARA